MQLSVQSPGNSVSIPSLSQSDDVQAVFQGCTPSNVSGKIRKRRVALPGRVITGEGCMVAVLANWESGSRREPMTMDTMTV